MSIVGLSTLKEYIPELAGSTGADSDLTNLIVRTESAVARYLGIPNADSNYKSVLDEATYTFYVDSPTIYDFYTLQIPMSPIVSVTSVHSDPNRLYDSTTLINSSTYTINSTNGRIYLDPNTSTRNFVDGYRANKIIVVAGYSTSTAPEDLKHAICVWCSQLHRNKANQGKDSITQANSTVKITKKTMPEEVKELLQPYRVPGLIL